MWCRYSHPHFIGGETEAQKGNLAWGYTACRWQHKDSNLRSLPPQSEWLTIVLSAQCYTRPRGRSGDPDRESQSCRVALTTSPATLLPWRPTAAFYQHLLCPGMDTSFRLLPVRGEGCYRRPRTDRCSCVKCPVNEMSKYCKGREQNDSPLPVEVVRY